MIRSVRIQLKNEARAKVQECGVPRSDLISTVASAR